MPQPTRAAIRDLHPAAFAFVMATGIISASAASLGPAWLSRALLVLAAAGFVLLSAALLIRLAVFRAALVTDLRAPDRVFGFFTIVAASNVLGTRLATAGYPVATAVLAGLAAAVWLLLSYGVPVVPLARDRDSVPGTVSGAWLLWAVGTQSLSVAASDLAPAWPSQARLLAGVAIALWSIGVVLYLLIVLGLWRYARRRWPLRYEPDLWSVVFPLGMYSAATFSFAAAAGLGFMEPLSRVMLWAAVAAWVAVAAAFLRRVAEAGKAGQPPAGAASR